MKKSSFSVSILCGFILLLSVGCRSDGFITEIPPESGSGISTEEYLFLVGDQFEVSFLNNPNFNASLTVRPDGRISMNLANDLLVAGMTPSELTELLTELYREEIKDPKVSIIMNQFAGQRIWVAGEVNSPGSMPLLGRMTVLQSIFSAGGWMSTALLENVIVVRHDDAKRETVLYTMNIEKRMNGEKTDDFVLRPNDVIYVPKSLIASVGDWVDLWINQPMPRWARLGFSYRLNPR